MEKRSELEEVRVKTIKSRIENDFYLTGPVIETVAEKVIAEVVLKKT